MANAALAAKDNSKEASAAFVKKRGFMHENMAAALKSGHEICILGEYIAVSMDEYIEELERYFLAPKKTKKHNY